MIALRYVIVFLLAVSCFSFRASCQYLESLQNELSELKAMISGMAKSSEKAEEPQADPVEAEVLSVVDDNFKIINQMKDESRGVFEDYKELLVQKPDWDQETICKILKEFTSLEHYDSKSHDPNLLASFEEVSNTIGDFDDSYQKFELELRNLVNIFRIVDHLTMANGGIDKIQAMQHNVPITENQVHEFLEKLLQPLRVYSPDSTDQFVRNFILNASKAKFDDKERIPSYIVFGILDCVEKLRKNQFDALEVAKKRFFRNLESLITKTNELEKSLKQVESSDRTAPNTISYIKLLGTLSSLINKLDQESLNSFNEYFEKTNSLNNQLSKMLKNCLESQKSTEIFDHLPQKLTKN